MSSRRVTVFQWKLSSFQPPELCAVVFALRESGRVVEIDTEKRGEDWWMILRSVVPLPRAAKAVLEEIAP